MIKQIKKGIINLVEAISPTKQSKNKKELKYDSEDEEYTPE